ARKKLPASTIISPTVLPGFMLQSRKEPALDSLSTGTITLCAVAGSRYPYPCCGEAVVPMREWAELLKKQHPDYTVATRGVVANGQTVQVVEGNILGQLRN
ncbi:MAG: hypothetical protein KDD55_07665, partial [Bdellovibrionales bacterium]|nr:hypothetical protein [Bdellovibrionales bacterium]